MTMKQNYKSHIYNKLNYMYGIMTEKVYVSTETYIAYNDLTSDDDQPVTTGLQSLRTTKYDTSNFDENSSNQAQLTESIFQHKNDK